MGGSSPGSSVQDPPAKNTGVGCPFPPPRDLPDLGIEPASPALAGGFFTTEPPGQLPENRERIFT